MKRPEYLERNYFAIHGHVTQPVRKKSLLKENQLVNHSKYVLMAWRLYSIRMLLVYLRVKSNLFQQDFSFNV